MRCIIGFGRMSGAVTVHAGDKGLQVVRCHRSAERTEARVFHSAGAAECWM